MASSDDPGTHQALSPDGEQEEYVRDPGIVSADEGLFPRPNPDLRPNSPSENQLKNRLYILRKLRIFRVEIIMSQMN